MATLAAANVVAILNQWPVWGSAEVRPFLTDPAPQAAPSIMTWKARCSQARATKMSATPPKTESAPASSGAM